ncbi:hypothetical protein [Aliidiomarina quisquiliarum]|uniref:hypothetical protein n=1 Tax=Aliidiomarina quisquiliarum TaxID=2938947 RepID=UPI00208FA217|nr:hypothetical protein [Aliidiomarina quisquiliarum]MCO4320511.1 hypothetical protein [Aliidiomarina quisquiliarum]
MRLVVLTYFTIFLSGCSSHQPYPENWEVQKANESCLWLQGFYKNNGEYFLNERTYKTHLSAYFFESTQVEHSKVEFITFEVRENESYLIKAISENNVQIAETLINLDCNNGSLISSKDRVITGGEAGAIVLGTQIKQFRLVETIDGNLLLSSESSVAGMLLMVVPVAGSSSVWSKFNKYRT